MKPQHGSTGGNGPAMILALCAMMLVPAAMSAHGLKVTVAEQWSLLSKVLSFDRNFDTDGTDTISVGIVYQSRYRVSVDVKDELVEALRHGAGSMLFNHPVVGVPIDLTPGRDIQAAVANANLTAAYIAPLHAAEIERIAAAFARLEVLTLTGVEDYVGNGVAVGIIEQGGHPHIKINLAAAKAAGADFSSQLLKIATVINP